MDKLTSLLILSKGGLNIVEASVAGPAWVNQGGHELSVTPWGAQRRRKTGDIWKRAETGEQEGGQVRELPKQPG